MEFGLKDKRVLVAGGSRGIGFAIANSFLTEGARVAIIARGAAALKDAATALGRKHGRDRILDFAIDCADARAWDGVVGKIQSEWGSLDVAIANVGNGQGPQDALPARERFSSAWRENFTTAEETARATLPMLEEAEGCLLFISSIAGVEAVGAPTDYSVAKAAVIALTKQIARRTAPRVRVNCIAPGNVFVAGGSWEQKLKEDRSGVERMLKTSVPMQRFAAPEEIADAAVFLCSARAGFITGACLVVDGGQTARMP